MKSDSLFEKEKEDENLKKEEEKEEFLEPYKNVKNTIEYTEKITYQKVPYRSAG